LQARVGLRLACGTSRKDSFSEVLQMEASF
jgi:hypothetical protein